MAAKNYFYSIRKFEAEDIHKGNNKHKFHLASCLQFFSLLKNTLRCNSSFLSKWTAF
jgi:hypothetical protein